MTGWCSQGRHCHGLLRQPSELEHSAAGPPATWDAPLEFRVVSGLGAALPQMDAPPWSRNGLWAMFCVVCGLGCAGIAGLHHLLNPRHSSLFLELEWIFLSWAKTGQGGKSPCMQRLAIKCSTEVYTFQATLVIHLDYSQTSEIKLVLANVGQMMRRQGSGGRSSVHPWGPEGSKRLGKAGISSERRCVAGCPRRSSRPPGRSDGHSTTGSRFSVLAELLNTGLVQFVAKEGDAGGERSREQG